MRESEQSKVRESDLASEAQSSRFEYEAPQNTSKGCVIEETQKTLEAIFNDQLMDCPVNLLEEINKSFEKIKQQPPKEKRKKKRLNETLGSDSTHTRKRKKLFKMRSTLSRQT